VSDPRKHIAIFVPSMRGGGAERVMLTLANAFAERGHKVDLILARSEGPYLKYISERVTLINLNAPRVLRSLWPLLIYLRREKPDALLSALNYANFVAIIAWKLARVPTRLTVSERTSLSRSSEKSADKITLRLIRWLYPKADKVICVSKGIETDMKQLLGASGDKISTIYNPVDVDMIHQKMNAPLNHPWLSDQTLPVILAAGRLTEAKDYPTLLMAFAKLRKKHDARLIIIGQGEEEVNLKILVEKLDIENDVEFAGFQDNPFAWMARCDLFVMSSAWEGFPNALIEAMTCGARIISTDCLTGPAEILEDGRWGTLVPVGDVVALAYAMSDLITETSPRCFAEQISRFEQDKIVSQYLGALVPRFGALENQTSV